MRIGTMLVLTYIVFIEKNSTTLFVPKWIKMYVVEVKLTRIPILLIFNGFFYKLNFISINAYSINGIKFSFLFHRSYSMVTT